VKNAPFPPVGGEGSLWTSYYNVQQLVHSSVREAAQAAGACPLPERMRGTLPFTGRAHEGFRPQGRCASAAHPLLLSGFPCAPPACGTRRFARAKPALQGYAPPVCKTSRNPQLNFFQRHCRPWPAISISLSPRRLQIVGATVLGRPRRLIAIACIFHGKSSHNSQTNQNQREVRYESHGHCSAHG